VDKRVLYFGGLSESVTNEQLRDLFGSYGVVSRARVIGHKYGTQSAGFAFVEMKTAEQAIAAMIDLHGSLLAGHSLCLYVTLRFPSLKVAALPRKESI
jgi:RNA recognition motif-containing protein